MGKGAWIPIAKKLEIVKQLEKGHSARNISRQFDVPLTTIYYINKTKEKVYAMYECSAAKMYIDRRRNALKANTTKVEAALIKWVEEQLIAGIELTPGMVKSQAKQIRETLSLETFAFANCWLAKFVEQTGLKLKVTEVSPEKAVARYIKLFSDIVSAHKLAAVQVFNVCETSFPWKPTEQNEQWKVSEKSITLNDNSIESTTQLDVNGTDKNNPKKRANEESDSADEASNFAAAEDTITILACSNASGSFKSKLYILDKASYPESFINEQYPPELISSGKTATLTKDTIVYWFNHEFAPRARAHLTGQGLAKDTKIFVFIDKHCDSIKNESLVKGNVHAVFLPYNHSHLIQPMEQGLLNAIKTRYESRVRKGVKEGFDAHQAGNLVNEIWAEFTTESIVEAWSKLWGARMKTIEPTTSSDWLVRLEHDYVKFDDVPAKKCRKISAAETEKENLVEHKENTERSEVVTENDSKISDNINVDDNAKESIENDMLSYKYIEMLDELVSELGKRRIINKEETETLIGIQEKLLLMQTDQ